MKSIFIILISLIYSSYTSSKDMFVYKYFSFEHPTCNIWIPEKSSTYWKQYGEDFRDIVFKRLKTKRFTVKTFASNQKKIMNKSDLYLTLHKTILPEGIYKKCLVKFQIKQVSTRFQSLKDKVLYQKDALRSLPRHTFRGEERCIYALKDSFGIIPYCTKTPSSK